MAAQDIPITTDEVKPDAAPAAKLGDRQMTDFVSVRCSACDIRFGMSDTFYKARRNDHGGWFCPNGHSMLFAGESEAEKMRRERDQALQQIARAEDERAETQRELELAKKREKNLTRKLAAGNCPCCKRSFANMSEHMRKQHPEFVADNVILIEKKMA